MVDPKLVRKLKRRASAHGISAEEEHRRILAEVLSPADKPVPSLIEFLLTEPVATDVELEIARRR